jgi:hypothetical protein
LGSHPYRLISITYEIILDCHGRNQKFRFALMRVVLPFFVRASGATLEALLFLIAAFWRLAKSLNHSEQMGWLVGAVGIESTTLVTDPALMLIA